MVDAINPSVVLYNSPFDKGNNSSPVKPPELSKINSDNKDSKGNNNNKLNKVELEKAANQLNNKFDLSNRAMQFTIHEKTGEVLVKIINKATNDVIMEIPSHELLDLKAKIDEMVGLIIDRKA
ncbi:MAG: flagellar protein FlaG [Nitrospira sp.]|nr:flagellar protein FlaG [Nitrospira sp.]